LLILTCQHNQPELVHELVEGSAFIEPMDNIHQTPLVTAARYGYLPIVDDLIAHGANISRSNQDGTPLSHALQGAHDEAAELVLRNWTLPSPHIWEHGRTALHLAAKNNCVRELRMLITRGVDVNVIDGFGYAPLDYAFHAKNPEMRKLLLDNEAFGLQKGFWDRKVAVSADLQVAASYD
jgi:ankyrin repeat protein